MKKIVTLLSELARDNYRKINMENSIIKNKLESLHYKEKKIIDMKEEYHKKMIKRQAEKDYIIGDYNKPEDSLLYEVITDPFEPMPPPRSGLSKLTEAEVKVLADWIKADLPN